MFNYVMDYVIIISGAWMLLLCLACYISDGQNVNKLVRFQRFFFLLYLLCLCIYIYLYIYVYIYIYPFIYLSTYINIFPCSVPILSYPYIHSLINSLYIPNMSVKTPIRSDSTGKDLKRSPTTPLTPSIISQNNIIRRKLNNNSDTNNKLDFKNSTKDSNELTVSSSSNDTSTNVRPTINNMILHDILINNWTMNKELNRVNSLLKFTETENLFK